jgi:stage V sporulation protein G
VEITEVRIKLMESAEDRLRAFCSITLDDCFVVRDLKIIDGANGPFVAMPSRRLTSHCRTCNTKNHLRARFCNHCGRRLPSDLVETDEHGRARLYADIAHPVNARCREMIQERVIGEFQLELERAQQPGYVSRYDDDYEDRSRRDAALSQNQLPEAAEPDRPVKGPHFVRPKERGAPASDIRDDRTTPPGEPESHARKDFGDGIF